MMENSFQVEDKVKYDIEVGKLRSIEVNAGTYRFRNSSMVYEDTNDLVQRYESERERGHHPIDLAILQNPLMSRLVYLEFHQ